MRKLGALLIVLFLLIDAAAFLVWWTHPKGARSMGFSGRVPFALPFATAGPAEPAEAPAEPLPPSVTQKFDEKSPDPGPEERAKDQPKGAQPAGATAAEEEGKAPAKKKRRKKAAAPKAPAEGESPADSDSGLLDDKSFGDVD